MTSLLAFLAALAVLISASSLLAAYIKLLTSDLARERQSGGRSRRRHI
jgi:hypothetical protein